MEQNEVVEAVAEVAETSAKELKQKTAGAFGIGMMAGIMVGKLIQATRLYLRKRKLEAKSTEETSKDSNNK